MLLAAFALLCAGEHLAQREKAASKTFEMIHNPEEKWPKKERRCFVSISSPLLIA
jgi:hypothetical protein